MSAVFAGSLAAFLRRPLDVAGAAAGAVLFVAVLWLVQRVATRDDPAAAAGVGARSFLISGGVLGGLATFFALARYTVSNNDSFMSYWPLGVSLNRTGAFTVSLISGRGPFLPAVSAIHVALGSDWAYVIYPMLGATLLYWCALSLLSGPLSAAAVRTARLVAGGAVLFLVLEPSFLFHSFFVHSHMVSAVCLADVADVDVARSSPDGAIRRPDRATPTSCSRACSPQGSPWRAPTGSRTSSCRWLRRSRR